MALIDQAAAQIDEADLIILALVESLRGRDLEANASKVHTSIGGAPYPEIRRRLIHLHMLGLLESAVEGIYMLSPMGAELLAWQIEGWIPVGTEQRRRDAQLASAITGAAVPRAT
jgi:hypothetical protein